MAIIRQVMPIKAPEIKAVRVAAYARVSSGKEAMLHSLSTQISYFSGYIQSHPGWQFVEIYADEAMTGTRDDRPEFQRMLHDCRDGKIDMIITKAVSRFSRNAVTLLEVTRELKALGIVVYFQKEGLYSDRGQGELVISLLATVAQEESRAVSDNCKWRIRSKMKAGELVGFSGMYGYRIQKGHVAIEPDEARVVSKMFEAYLAGTGCEEIARSLNHRRVPALKGGAWTSNRILSMLKNEKYTGNALLQKRYYLDHLTKKSVRNRGQLAQYFATGTHPAIVSTDVFERTRQMIELNRQKNNAVQKPPAHYPLSGVIQCGNCGRFFSRVKRNGHPKWQCATYRRKGMNACPAKEIPEETLYSLLCDTLGLEVFDATILQTQIAKILITGPNTVRFIFHGGREMDAQWQDRSRSESWTEEMRNAARELMKSKG